MFIGQKGQYAVRLTSEAVYNDKQQLTFTADRITTPDGHMLVGSMNVTGFCGAMLYKGDIVSIKGSLYSRRGNQNLGMSFAEISLMRHEPFWVDEFGRRFAAALRSGIPEPTATFAIGLLVGQQSDLPQPVQDTLRHVGLTHIIAVSGYNLTVLVMAARRIREKYSKFQTLVISILLLVFFLLLTGRSPPIVRASIICSLSLWAWYFGRTIRPLVLLFASAAISVYLNPSYLWGNVSWYLSFLAFVGVLLFAPTWSKALFGDKEPPMLAALVIETLGATLTVLPYSLYVFGQLSTVSLLANIMVVPLVPLAMLFSAATGFVGIWLPSFIGYIAWPAHLLLLYMLDIAQWWSERPHSFLGSIALPVWGMAALYASLAVITFAAYHNVRRRSSTVCPKAAIVTSRK